MSNIESFQAATEGCRKLVDNVSKVFIGKTHVVTNVILSLVADGHILLEDVPGVGKTLLAKAVAKSIAGKINRIQFTADLLPTDVTGVTAYNQNTGEFQFRQGPIFANVLLGDEINRATPRTQSSLLEAMEEQQVTVDGVCYPLAKPFFVISTQNPIELEGTYPLPFSQMDRFLTRLDIGYLDGDEEKQMLIAQKVNFPLDDLGSVIGCDDLIKIQEMIRHISISDELLDYLIEIIRLTRCSEGIEFGASPRGSLDLMRFSQALALLDGRDYVLPDDIKKAAPLVLSHRIIVKKGTRLSTAGQNGIIEELVEGITVPI